MINLSFYPDGKRAIALDRRMRAELASSLQQLSTQIETQMQSSEAVLLSKKLHSVISSLDTQKQVSPAVFAAYYQLVFSILNEESDLTEKVDYLISVFEYRNELSFYDLSTVGLGNDKLVSLYNFALDTDDRLSFEFLTPSQEESQKTKASVLRGLALMQKIVPAMADEFSSIVSEVILAAASRKPNAPRFDGASSYMLWGSLVLSVDDEKSDVEMMETLAHEGGHSFLFGLTMEEPLTYNKDDELFDSPLRQDPRPMDGIYHATFVSARMHYAMNEAGNSGLLSEQQLEECSRYLAASRKAFFDGYSVVNLKGDLSPTGNEIMQNAYQYMQESAVE